MTRRTVRDWSWLERLDSSRDSPWLAAKVCGFLIGALVLLLFASWWFNT